MEIRENTYIDASRARDAGITEEMVRESVNRIDDWRYSDNTWYICSFGELCSHSGKFTTYVFNYGDEETDVTDEFIEWFKPSKKELNIKTISYKDVQENFLDSGELDGVIDGKLELGRLKEAGLRVEVECENILNEKYLAIWKHCDENYTESHLRLDVTDAFIKKYGDTTKEGLDVLNLNYSQLEPFDGEWLGTETKQKHKAYEKLFK